MAKSLKHRILWTALLFVYFAGIYFSFTRAAHLCVFIIFGAYFIVKYNWSKYAITLSLIGSLVVLSFLIRSNKYLDFAPDYHKTITHINFDNLLEATYKMEDISTMERVYRWVAGLQMAKERPLLGFGPGCFYPFYKQYSISRFRTYVSDNPDKSGIHNYYFMTMIEQGIFGFLIILFLCFAPIIYGESIYHSVKSKRDKSIIMAAILSLIVIDALLLINDLLETDKLGSIFLFNLSIIVLIDIINRNSKKIVDSV